LPTHGMVYPQRCLTWSLLLIFHRHRTMELQMNKLTFLTGQQFETLHYVYKFI
jgi:hypothetical protein